MAHQSRELRQVTESRIKDGRGGRQYTLPRVLMRDLAPGICSIFTRFEAAARKAESAGWQLSDYNLPQDEYEAILADAERQKQAMLRALVRLQNKGPEDVEAIKGDLKKACAVINAVRQAPGQSIAIIESTKVMPLVDTVLRRKRGGPGTTVAAFQSMLDAGRKRP